jgi:hypothetical protein
MKILVGKVKVSSLPCFDFIILRRHFVLVGEVIVQKSLLGGVSNSH